MRRRPKEIGDRSNYRILRQIRRRPSRADRQWSRGCAPGNDEPDWAHSFFALSENRSESWCRKRVVPLVSRWLIGNLGTLQPLDLGLLHHTLHTIEQIAAAVELIVPTSALDDFRERFTRMPPSLDELPVGLFIDRQRFCSHTQNNTQSLDGVDQNKREG